MQIETPALHFVCESPPSVFEDEFPLVAEYYLFHITTEPNEQGHVYDLTAVYVPEDAEFLQAEAALLFIMRLAPITTFSGARSITVTIPEGA